MNEQQFNAQYFVLKLRFRLHQLNVVLASRKVKKTQNSECSQVLLNLTIEEIDEMIKKRSKDKMIRPKG